MDLNCPTNLKRLLRSAKWLATPAALYHLTLWCTWLTITETLTDASEILPMLYFAYHPLLLLTLLASQSSSSARAKLHAIEQKSRVKFKRALDPASTNYSNSVGYMFFDWEQQHVATGQDCCNCCELLPL